MCWKRVPTVARHPPVCDGRPAHSPVCGSLHVWRVFATDGVVVEPDEYHMRPSLQSDSHISLTALQA